MKLPHGMLLIDGSWRRSASGKTFSTSNPATEEAIATLQEANETDVDLAVRSARRAVEEGAWSKISPADRGKLLFKMADLIEQKIDEFAEIETADCGKPLWQTKGIEIPLVASTFRYFAGWTTKIVGETLPVHGNHLNYTLKDPVGVVAAIPPWNYPLLLSSWKVAPAIATGNAVVLKPSSQTPLSALKLGEIALAAGLPAGVLNIVTGPGGTTGMALVRHPGVDKISFTGETTTGKTIMRECAGSLKRISLELGGKSPSIVFGDAELELAATGVYNSIYFNKGESCAACSRLLVEESVHDKLMELLTEKVRKTVVGDPLDPQTTMGPLTSRGQVEKVKRYIESGIGEGAKLVAGREKQKMGKGSFVNPVLFDHVDNGMKIAKEEVFGPFLTVTSFKDVDSAVRFANDTQFGLAASLWTRDVRKAHAVARRIQAGTVWINPAYALFDPASPFGGYKMSGFGREQGSEVIKEYTQVKSVWINTQND